jgi:large subunit ribosomal protein L31
MDVKVIMKKDLHPDNYRLVVFQDTSSDFKILTKSTAQTTETIKWEDGNEYPLIKVHVSSASHPFFTGEEKVLDIEGRVDKFKARAEAAAKAKEAKIAAAKKAESKPVKKPTKKKEVTEEGTIDKQADSKK